MPVKKAERVKVTLIAPHTHAGEQKQAGDEISVTPDQKAWLIKQNVIKGENN